MPSWVQGCRHMFYIMGTWCVDTQWSMLAQMRELVHGDIHQLQLVTVRHGCGSQV